MSELAGVLREHPRHLIAAATACGIALCSIGPIAAFAAAAGAVCLLSALPVRPHVAIAVAAMLLVGFTAGQLRLSAIDADPLASAPRGELTLRGHLVALPRETRYGVRLRVRLTEPAQTIEIRSRAGLAGSPRIGDAVLASGSLSAISASGGSSPQADAYGRHLLRSGVRRRMFARQLMMTGERRSGVLGVIDRVRVRAEDSLARGLAPEPAALLRGMVLGGDAGIPETTAEDFRIAGLSHILAVSGANVLLIVILAQTMMVALGVPRGRRLAIVAGVVIVYVTLCGAQASVIRAGAMGLAGLAAIAASRPASRIYALTLAAIVVLLFNPRATADVGAQLSFAAVLGMMAFTGPLAGRLGVLPRWSAETLAATAGATIATAPLMAHHFSAVSLVALAANTLGEPLIGPIVWLGALTAAIGQLSEPLAALLGAPNSFLLGALIELAHLAASVPGAQLAAAGFGGSAVVGGYAALALAAGAVNGWIDLPAWRLLAPPLAIAGIAATLLIALAPARDQVQGPALVMLDVGQGDATLLVGEGCTALVDGGPPGGDLRTQLGRLGVRRLDALLVTHPEDDHFGGALELARSGDPPVGTLLDGGGNTENAGYIELRRLLAGSGTRMLPAVTGTRWGCAGMSINVIAPAPLPASAPPPAEPNTRAAVTEITIGPMRLFASGDAESPQLAALALAPAEILKVAHHGSDDSGLAPLLARLRPRVALIGVGARNRYGHPTPGTLAALAAAGVAVHRTDREGTLIVRPAAGGGLTVSAAGAGR